MHIHTRRERERERERETLTQIHTICENNNGLTVLQAHPAAVSAGCPIIFHVCTCLVSVKLYTSADICIAKEHLEG